MRWIGEVLLYKDVVGRIGEVLLYKDVVGRIGEVLWYKDVVGRIGEVLLYQCFNSADLKQRNILVAQKWAELTDEERKIWSIKAEAMCENTTYVEPEITMETAQEPDSPEVPTSSLIESTLMKIQEKVCTCALLQAYIFYTVYWVHSVDYLCCK